MDLQPYSQYCFSKISRILFDFLNNTYWLSLFQRNNSLIFWTGVSCFSVTFFYFTLFCCGGKANLVRFTLFYSTLLTLTDGMMDGGTNTLVSRGVEEPFFQLCCCVSFWFWREIGFGCTYYYVLGVPYSCGVVLVILVLAGNSFWCYVRTECIIQIVITTGKKSSSRKKKVLVVCLAGARSLLRPEKKFQSSVWRVRDRYYDRKKKIQS